jgi:two-component system, cell cycle sensor histidine kinase and response regulator CckA
MLETARQLRTGEISAERMLMLAWAFERSSDGIILTDLKGIIQMANDAFCTMFEYPRDEVVGQRTGFLKSEYSTQDFYRQMWASLKAKGQWKGEIVNRTKTGKEKVCFLTITPITNDDGERIGYLGVEIDLTERKLLEEQMAHAERLAAVGEAMSTLAHEIRNPLNGIRMNAFLLEKGMMTGNVWTEDDTESVSLIKRETTRLQELVNSVLSFSRKQDLHYERVNISDLIGEVLDLERYQAEERSVQLDTELHDEAYTIRCDANLMKQVLLNLVQNAIEEAAEEASSPLKRVLIRCVEKETQDHSLSVTGVVFTFEIYNTGRTLSREDQQKMFKPFFTTKAQGLGLGLATSLKIVRQHGGTIMVASPVEESAGEAKNFATRFSVVLPV